MLVHSGDARRALVSSYGGCRAVGGSRHIPKSSCNEPQHRCIPATHGRARLFASCKGSGGRRFEATGVAARGHHGPIALVSRAARLMIRFEHVEQRYAARPILSDVSFELSRGQLGVLLGASGSGKTTALKLVNRLLE